MLILSNEEIQDILTMHECLEVLEEMYSDYAMEQVLSLPRVDNIAPCSHESGYYAFKHMGGIWPRKNIMALRINSDIITHPVVKGLSGKNLKRVKVPAANGRWVGLVGLFSTETGELLSIFPDGVAQRMRVGATNGLGIKYLSRKNATIAGLIGSGWQAGAQLLALLSVRDIKEVKVYSPRVENRNIFVNEMRKMTNRNILAVNSPEECVKDVDIVLASTSSLAPVIRKDWLSEGMHVSCIKVSEVDEDVLNKCNKVVVHTKLQSRQIDNIFPGTKNVPKEHLQGWWKDESFKWNNFLELASLVNNHKLGRTDTKEITCFVNNVGLGLQFAALGSLIIKKAKKLGLGKDLPGEWFSETVHP